MTAATINSHSNALADATIVAINNIVTHQPVNGSFCCIVSLEVYRGREQITEISHDGFSLSDRGTVEVNHIQTLLSCFHKHTVVLILD